MAPRMDGPAFGDDAAIITASLPAALAPQPDRPVFTDDTGLRAAVLQWGSRGGCLLGALLCTALVLTLQTHVSIPSLEKAFLGSSEGLRPSAGRSDVPISLVAPRTELRGESGQIGVVGQRGQLPEPTLDSAATEVREVADTPITEQRARRAIETSTTADSDTQSVAGTPTQGGSPPVTVTEHPPTKAGAVPGSGGSKTKASAGGKAYRPPAASKIRNPHAAPKIRNPRAATPGSGRQTHSS